MSDSEVDQLEDESFVWPNGSLLQELDDMRNDRDQKQMENDILADDKKKLVETVATLTEKNLELLNTIRVLNRRLQNCRDLKYKLEDELEQLWNRIK